MVYIISVFSLDWMLTHSYFNVVQYCAYLEIKKLHANLNIIFKAIYCLIKRHQIQTKSFPLMHFFPKFVFNQT